MSFLKILSRCSSLSFVLLLFSLGFWGALSGGLMGAIGGHIYPVHYDLFDGISPMDARDYWRHVARGVVFGGFEGCFCGASFGVLVWWVSRARGTYEQARPYLLKIVALVWIFWLVGGINGVLISFCFPNSMTFAENPGTLHLPWIWETFSNLGAFFGAPTALIFGCSWFARDWKRGKVAGV